MNFPPIQIAAAPASSSSSSSSSAVLNWSFSPVNLNILYSLGASSNVTTLTVTPSDYASAAQYSGLTNFRTEINIINQGTWLAFLSNALTEAFETFTGPSFNLDLVLFNVSTLSVGNYSANIKFDVMADDSSGATVFIETKYKFVGLQVSASPQLEVDSNNFQLTTILNSSGTGQFSLNITANNNWTISNITPGLNLTSVAGNGSALVHFSVSSSYVFSSVGNQVFGFKVNGPGGLFEVINLVVTVEDVQTNVSITELNITQSIGQPGSTGSFDIQTNQSFTITVPAWLSLNTMSGSSSTQVLWTVPSGSSYQNLFGNMVINFGSQTITIPVTYLVINFINSDALNSGINFTRDNKILTFSRGLDPDVFVRLEIDGIADYLNVNESELEFEDVIQDIGFPDSNVDFNIGEFCENLFPKWFHPSKLFSDFPFSTTEEIIRPMDLSVYVKKLGYDGAVLINTVDLDDFSFIRGNKKDGPLNISIQNTSVVNGGFAIVHILSDDSFLWSWRSGNVVSTSGSTPTSSSKKIWSFLYKVDTPHKFIWFKYGAEKLLFFVRPEVTDPASVFFKNEHCLPEVLTFRGGIEVESRFGYKQNKLRSGFDRRTESLDFEETVTVTLSTGGLLPEDIPKLIELLKNEIATLYYRGKEYYVNPINQKVIPLSSSRNINQFSVKLNMSKRDYDSIV